MSASRLLLVSWLVLLCWPSAAGAQHTLNQRMRDVTLGRYRGREVGAVAEARSDFGFLHGSNVFRTDVAGILTRHPQRRYRRKIDLNLGLLLSYAVGGAYHTQAPERRSGAFSARPFVITPLRWGELIWSLGVSGGARACKSEQHPEECAQALSDMPLAALARPADLADLVPARVAMRSAFSYNLDLGFVSARGDLSYDRLKRSYDAGGILLEDTWAASGVLGLAFSLTVASVFVNYALVVADNQIWGTAEPGVIRVRAVRNTPGDFEIVNVLAAGARVLCGRHAQFALSYKHPFNERNKRFGFVGLDLEFPL
jgi:hypothetical protein